MSDNLNRYYFKDIIFDLLTNIKGSLFLVVYNYICTMISHNNNNKFKMMRDYKYNLIVENQHLNRFIRCFIDRSIELAFLSIFVFLNVDGLGV